MSLSLEEIQELSRILDARAGLGRSERPKLRLVVPPTSKLLDPIFRDAHIKRIIHLRDAYRLRWLVDQATFNVASLSCLEDCDLIRLLNDMERARECIVDGISFEDAGLVRSVNDCTPAPTKTAHSVELAAERAEMYTSRIRKLEEPRNPLLDPAPF